MCGDARGAAGSKEGLKTHLRCSRVSLCRAGYASTRAFGVRTSDADIMGGGICVRQLVQSSRGLFGPVMGGVIMGGQHQSVMHKSLLRRMLSTETRADKIHHIQAEREKTQPARWNIFACLHLGE